MPQRRLRALLALGMFIHGPTSLWPRHVSLADVTRYTLVVSPRYDDLVITTRVPDNVTCWLVCREDHPLIGLPGLRVESRHEDGWRLRHLTRWERRAGAGWGRQLPERQRTLRRGPCR